ncbi:MAG: TAT-variant-translocated molybdopterin oxidoreductase [Flavobacteriales bacterium]|nr:TAT-variant-translocated molybdopterin oxidoreductase [Flavobacteriales bacterium]
MANSKKYWVGLEELDETKEFQEAQQNEFAPEGKSVDQFLDETDLDKTSTNRRDFLKFLGFSVTAATVAACETPVIHSIPYVNKPEQITPGLPTFYASTYFDGVDYGSVIVRTREGRPIFMRGNSEHGLNRGVNARINSSILSLYDSTRLQGPKIAGEKTTWGEIDQKLGAEISKIAENGGQVRFLSGTNISPSTAAVVERFSTSLGEGVFEEVTYDPISFSSIRKANEASFGSAVIPDYNFYDAKVIASLGADFMNSWLLDTEYTSRYVDRRKPSGEWMNKHYQVESRMSLTGSNADVRMPILPSQEGAFAVALHNEVAKLTSGSRLSGTSSEGLPMEGITALAKDLADNRGECLVISGSNDPDIQIVVNSINAMLGNYGSTIHTNKEVFLNQGSEESVQQLIKDMKAGKVDALIIGSGINPAYSLPNADEFVDAMSKVKVLVSFSGSEDETASRCTYLCPDSNYLESWNDLKPKTGHYALVQPTINRLFDTRQFQDSFLKWSGEEMSYHDFIRGQWSLMHGQTAEAPILFEEFWYHTVRNGTVSIEETTVLWEGEFSYEAAQRAASRLKSTSAQGYEVELYTKVGIGDGRHATNPWLQELPDPVSKVTWDNYIAMNPGDLEAEGFNMHLSQEKPASLVTLTVDGKELTLPVIPQPGQKKGSVSVALGYGRGQNNENIGRAAYRTKQYGGYETDADGKMIPIGKNVFPLVTLKGGSSIYKTFGATITDTGETFPIASTQIHHTLMGRDSVVKETTLSVYKNSPKEAYNPPHQLAAHEDGKNIKKDVEEFSLWEEHPVANVGHKWGASIDLSTCIGCGACVTACHMENNVPVVGKDEIRRGRDMHWLRIDRYYSSDMSLEKGAEQGMGIIETYGEMEIPEYDNPSTVHMPMMCQHCNHAPCETVCPVAATTHSNEGLNQMTYNRCIGTRYCANNCPYKVRRFNWFNYKAYDKFAEVNPSQDAMARMVLNPDVTVRSRGVMEKCSMCVQRIQAGKLEAKMKGVPLRDGMITSACKDACPTDGIIFGDLNDSTSQVSKEVADDRTYYALEETGVRPSVSYQVKVRNV